MYLGIDLGTSEVKVLLINEQQHIVTSQQALWAEQHPADWWQATQWAIVGIRRSHPRELSALRGIGLSGQMHGAVLLDEAGQVLRPAMGVML